MRRTPCEQKAARISLTVPKIFGFWDVWATCEVCKDEVKGEPIWSYIRYGVYSNWREYVCTKCCPTKEDCLKQIL